MPLAHLKQHMERTFRQLAADKGLDFNVRFDGKLPDTIRTDEKRLQQIVLNLLSNAFKFTSKGGVTLSVRSADEGLEQEPSGPAERQSGDRDCGHRYRHRHSRRQAEIDLRGLSAGRRHDQPQIRRHGPRPSISREIARLIGGELQVRSKPGEGSTFTLYVPLEAEVPGIGSGRHHGPLRQ